MKPLLLTIWGLLLGTSIFAQKINSKESKVTFEVTNMGKVVQGTILNMSGQVHFDAQNIEMASFEASIDPKTIQTGNRGRDKHLQKEDFLGVAHFPTITIHSKKIVQTETGYKAIAMLTIRDISLEVQIPFEATQTEKQQQLTGNFTIQRKDFQLGEKVGEHSIGLEVSISIYCVVDK